LRVVQQSAYSCVSADHFAGFSIAFENDACGDGSNVLDRTRVASVMAQLLSIQLQSVFLSGNSQHADLKASDGLFGPPQSAGPAPIGFISRSSQQT
jgi:hypothetical protein